MKAAALLVAGALIFLAGIVVGAGISRTPTYRLSSPSSSVAVPARAVEPAYKALPQQEIKFVCPDCDAEGIPIYIRSEPQNGRIVCELRKFTWRKGTLLGETVLANGARIYHVQAVCGKGWLAASLVDLTP